MRGFAWFSFVCLGLVFAATPTQAQNFDDDLRVYAVSIINVVPFKSPVSGYGVYLGNGAILTAAHVVGRWSLFSTPRVLIAGQELLAKVVKKGSFEQTDLALLAVDETSLPVSLRLRRNPLCKMPLNVGMSVVVVYPERTARSKIISPKSISPAYRARFSSLINDVQGSGSGAYSAERKCLLGIMSASVRTSNFQGQNERAGYFVPASRIADFIPAELRF
jgi:hypothetical protein